LEVDKGDYSALFATVEHEISCKEIPPTSLRLHFIRHDAGGLVPMGRLVNTLITYITHFCLTSQRRNGLGEKERNRAFLEARRLFRESPTSGQPGEVLIYFLIEAVLQAPQVLKKMLLTTNPNDERKGSDGVHVRWVGDKEQLEVLFAEAKLHQDFASAVKSAFVSMTDFHNSATKELEVHYFLNAFSLLDQRQREFLKVYIEGEKKDRCQEVHVCLVGYDWKEYECLKDDRNKDFIKEFEARYLSWAETTIKLQLDAELASFAHSHLRFEFFFLPFPSVANFRSLFLENL